MIKGFKPKFSQLLLLFVASVLVIGFFVYKTPEKIQKTPVDVLFIGDSITFGWNYHQNTLFAHFGNLVAVQGIGGIDTLDLHTVLSSTQSYRSRMAVPWYDRDGIAKTPHGQMHFALKGYQPRVVVLEIGVNNWLRTLTGSDESQIQSYKTTRNYKNLELEAIEEDSAIGSINKRGVYQIVMQIRKLYGEQTPIILVGAFPTYFVPDSAKFNALLKEFSSDKESPVSANTYYLDSVPFAQVGWSEEAGMYYDHSAFPADKEQFDSIHVDWGHLNKQGYDVYAKMLECPVKRALGEGFGVLGHKPCLVITAADMNASMSE